MPHFCHARCCLEEIGPTAFLCAACLRRLPGTLRMQVLAVSKSAKPWKDRPSREWQRAIDAAIVWLGEPNEVRPSP